MTNNELFEAIFHRKSIRKYDMTPLSITVLEEVRKYASNLKPLDETIKYEFAYLSTNDVKNLLPIKAPHYICLYSEKKGNYLMNAGFLLQQMDLYLSANKLGSCWLGMAKPSKQVAESKNNLEFVIMLAYGNSTERLHRADSSEFNRKLISNISEITVENVLIEPVRLAPSASNSQPWYFSGDSDEIVVSREKLNLIRAPLYGKMNQVDIGIALFHLLLSLDNRGKNATFDFEKSSVPKGYEFMAKVNVRGK